MRTFFFSIPTRFARQTQENTQKLRKKTDISVVGIILDKGESCLLLLRNGNTSWPRLPAASQSKKWKLRCAPSSPDERSRPAFDCLPPSRTEGSCQRKPGRGPMPLGSPSRDDELSGSPEMTRPRCCV